MIASRWALVLAILTHDSYLLLFDVPKGTPAYKKQLNARTPEVLLELRWALLVATVIIVEL